jgi:thiamine monophosphate synthase
VFPSASKPGRALSGAEALVEVVAATPLPVLAIGGVNVETARLVADAGAAGIAAIGLFSDGASQEISTTVADVVSAFDTHRPVP